MSVPIWLQIKKAELIEPKKEWKRLKGDKVVAFKTLTKLSYADSLKLFKIFGGKCETDLEFAQVIYDNYGSGIYLVIAGGKGICGFWDFLHFVISDDGAVVKRKPTSKTVKRKRLGIIQKRIDLLNEKVDTAHIEDKEWYDYKIMEEELDYFDLKYSKLERKKKRFGPHPYLKTILKYDKLIDEVKKEESLEEQGMNAIWG